MKQQDKKEVKSRERAAVLIQARPNHARPFVGLFQKFISIRFVNF